MFCCVSVYNLPRGVNFSLFFFLIFLIRLIKRAFSPAFGLFKESENRLLYPNPISGFIQPNHLEKFEFLGTLCGKALYENILVELPFANFFLGTTTLIFICSKCVFHVSIQICFFFSLFFKAKLLGKTNSVDDLESLDPQILKNLQFLKSTQNVSDLELNFTTAEDRLGETITIDLIPDGKVRIDLHN